MAYIDIIRVNGQQSSGTITPVIAGLNPVFTWDYVETADALSQMTFEIQIGTSSDNWGTDIFNYNILQDSGESSNSYEYYKHSLLRGVVYYGQIRSIDEDHEETSWSMFSFKINRVPTAINPHLTPYNPTSSDHIDVNYTFADPDGHEESGTKIRWYRDGLPVLEYDDLCTLPASATYPGESWNARIIPSDGLEFGMVSETGSVVIGQSDIYISYITILPSDANVDDILKADYAIIDNEYSPFTGTILIEWYVNGTLCSSSSSQYVRLSLEPGDYVYAVIKIIEGSSIISQKQSSAVIISDVVWHLTSLEISGLSNPTYLNDLTPMVEWKVFKTTAESREKPDYFRFFITKTPSFDGAVFDTGYTQYVKDSYSIPENVLSRGNQYFIHVGAGDTTPFDENLYITKEIKISGSSWSENVSNNIGWTIEFRAGIEINDDNGDPIDPTSLDYTPNIGLYINDGTYFCAVVLGLKNITFISDSSIVYTYASNLGSLQITGASTGHTFQICGKENDVRIYMDGKVVLDAIGLLTNKSALKNIEYGNIDGKHENIAVFRYFRYSTKGAYGLDQNVNNPNLFYFSNIGTIDGGSIEFVYDNFISFTSDNGVDSSKLITFNETGDTIKLPTVVKNYSPITSIYIDENRSKFIGTANGVTAIYGDKHDPDYVLLTSGSDFNGIKPEDFDRISNVPIDKLSLVEPNARTGWFTIDTTYRTIGTIIPGTRFLTGAGDPYNPYSPEILSRAIHYYSQRTHGHSWFDRVDNKIGWQVAFSFNLEYLEADDFQETDIDKTDFGIYINDGTRQEIIYFYKDRIRLYYANIYVPLDTTKIRNYVISGKDDSLLIYQRLFNSSTSGYQLSLNGAGLFTTPSDKSGNSRNPNIEVDSFGFYHAVWHDDGDRWSKIVYSFYDGQSWSQPESVVESSKFNLRNPRISIDSHDRIWVVYEDTSWGNTEISVSVRDTVGWNSKTRVTNFSSQKSNPDIIIDTNNNVHLVWQDNRNGNWEILWCQWDDIKKAWISSGHFGEDEVIMSYAEDDPYQNASAIDYKKPRMSIIYPYLWVVAEGHIKDDSTSAIYMGYRDLSSGYWNGPGSIIKENGEFYAAGISNIVSLSGRNCLNPDITGNALTKDFVVVWEDQTTPISQIWGSAWFYDTTNKASAQQITSRILNCKNPVCGYVSNQVVILYEADNDIYLSSYNPSYSQFLGSFSGYTDQLITIDNDKIVSNPDLPSNNISTTFILAYDFQKSRDVNSIESVEYPEYQLIGDAVVEHNLDSEFSITSTTETIQNGDVSWIDTKEFAFGDFSENVGIRAHWKDIEFYFGYDAKPQSVIKYNSNSVPSWPDDRVNDLFVDSYGNIVSATFGGLVYYNVFTNQLTLIEGHTPTYSSDTGCTSETCLLAMSDGSGKLITSVKWGGSGIWYVGTASGLYYTNTAGRTWFPIQSGGQPIFSNKIINDMVVDQHGNAIVSAISSGSSYDSSFDGIYVVNPKNSAQTRIPVSFQIRCVAVDENDIIWGGGDSGLIRIENYSNTNLITFDRSNGMRSSWVNDIAIVNKYLRYIATAAGIERMHGMKFASINVRTHELTNDNINVVEWHSSTNSLWVGSLYSLHEIIFRDVFHDIISDEVTHYDSSNISTEEVYDRSTYMILDFSQSDQNVTTESASIFINGNEIEFGYTVSNNSIQFLTNLLVNDQVEIEISNRFLTFKDFNQTNIEKSVLGFKRSVIKQMIRSSKNQYLVRSTGDKNTIMLYAGESSLPYDTISLDLVAPVGCIEQLDILSRSKIRFRILASDDLSGVESYMLSNYENFTSDGTNELDWSPIASVVDHDIGMNINNVYDSLSLETGTGSSLGIWNDQPNNKIYLYAGTSSPAVISRYDPTTEIWTKLLDINPIDSTTIITGIKTIDNVIYVTAGSPSGSGRIYKSVDGTNFDLVSSISGAYARGICPSDDGHIYFGSSDGSVYAYKDSILSLPDYLKDISESIYDLNIFNNILYIASGNKGRLYAIDLKSYDHLIIFDSPGTYLRSVYTDSETTTASNEVNVFVGDGSSTTIYRADVDNLDFIKSYSSFGKNIYKISGILKSVLNGGSQTSDTGRTTVAAIGDGLFKYNGVTWEMFYQHDNDIYDFIEYTTGGVPGVWVVSKNKVTKWTSELSTKTVYLRLKDKAGNISQVSDEYCPTKESLCCTSYSINISDLKDFVNANRILNVDEYGVIQYSYDSFNDQSFYSADQIDQEIGIYISEVLNGSNDLVSWKTITWESVEPVGTSVNVQIRSGADETECAASSWSTNLIKDDTGFVSIEHITDQFLQFKVILTSQSRNVSSSLTSVTIRNITSQASHFFTTNFILPSRLVKGIMTTNTFLPISSDIVFGINTTNSVDFSGYQIIEPNRIFTTTKKQFGENLRIGAKLLSPGIPSLSVSNNPGDPYDESSFLCNIDFDHTNIGSTNYDYHFRIRFYNDIYRTQLIYTRFSGNDQTGWKVGVSSFPSTGVSISAGETKSISYMPDIEQNQKWYVTIDAWNGITYENVLNNMSYICATCNVENDPGLISEYYTSFTNVGITLASMPIFSDFTPDYIFTEKNVNFSGTTALWASTDSAAPVSGIPGTSSNFAIRLKGRISCPSGGIYGFSVIADDGAILKINGDIVIDPVGSHTMLESETGSISLNAGFNDIELQYYETSGSSGLILLWMLPGESVYTVIPEDKFFHSTVSEYCESNAPKIFNIAIQVELENGETVKFNL
jgi:hypothetical protein